MAGVNILDTNMDMDLEYDDPELARMHEQAAQLNSLPDMAVEGEQEMQETNGVEEGEVPSDAPTLTQIFVESPGMRELGPSDMENFARDNFQSEHFQGLEWINDHSLKLTYANAEAATAALDALTATNDDALPPANPLELRRAKGLLTHANVEFFVRQAVGTDKKLPGAASRSEFFAKNPGYRRDPYERRDNRPRRGGYNGGPRRGRFAGNNARPTSSSGPEFDESLYDDDSATVAARRSSQDRRYSQDLIPNRRREPRRRDVDLIGDKRTGRLRDRSASPLRDGDGDGMYGFDEKVPHRQTARYRSPPAPNRRSRDENRDSRNSMRQELFPGKKPTTALTNGQQDEPTELFPAHASKSKDLFPEKIGRRRHDADDMYSEEATSALGNWDLHKQSPEGSYTPSGRSSRNHQNHSGTETGDLFSRITGGPGLQLKASQGRLNAPSDGFNIKGAGDDRGFEFRGASKGGSQRGGRNGGGDLFADKIKSRGAQRLQPDMY